MIEILLKEEYIVGLSVTYLTLWGKIMDLNKLKTNIISDASEESRLDFEDTRDGEGELSKPNEFSN